jgi:Terminase small subunit
MAKTGKPKPGASKPVKDRYRPLTMRQDRFARNYAKTGKGTQSAIMAGYAPGAAHVQANYNLRLPKIAEAVQVYRARTAERLDISREKILNDAAHDAEQASVVGDYSAANGARMLISKIQGYVIDRSLAVNVDITGQHIEALRMLMQRGGKANEQLVSEGQSNGVETSLTAPTAIEGSATTIDDSPSSMQPQSDASQVSNQLVSDQSNEDEE